MRTCILQVLALLAFLYISLDVAGGSSNYKPCWVGKWKGYCVPAHQCKRPNKCRYPCPSYKSCPHGHVCCYCKKKKRPPHHHCYPKPTPTPVPKGCHDDRRHIWGKCTTRYLCRPPHQVYDYIRCPHNLVCCAKPPPKPTPPPPTPVPHKGCHDDRRHIWGKCISRYHCRPPHQVYDYIKCPYNLVCCAKPPPKPTPPPPTPPPQKDCHDHVKHIWGKCVPHHHLCKLPHKVFSYIKGCPHGWFCCAKPPPPLIKCTVWWAGLSWTGACVPKQSCRRGNYHSWICRTYKKCGYGKVCCYHEDKKPHINACRRIDK